MVGETETEMTEAISPHKTLKKLLPVSFQDWPVRL